MKQILQSYRSGELWLAEVPAPACPRNGIKVMVHASLVSAGTEKRMIDLAKSSLLQKAMKRPDQVRRVIQKIKAEGFASTWTQVNAKLDSPVPLGYSASGMVVEVGSEATEFRVGQRVACAGVGYASHAEVIVVPRTLAVPLPEGLSFEEGSFGTLGAIAMQAVRQADVRVGELVGVIGLGLLGNLVAQILVASGARVAATDLDPAKRELALQLGVEAVGTDIGEVGRQISSGMGLDAIIIAAGSSESGIIQSCPAALRHRGRVVVLGFVGMDCPHQEFYNKELELRMSMSYGPGRYDPSYEEKGRDYPYPFVRWTEQRNIASFLGLVSGGRVGLGKLITHRFPFDDSLKAYELMESRQPYLGIVLNYAAREQAMGRVVEVGGVRGGMAGAKGIALIGSGGFAGGILGPIIKGLGIRVRSVTAQRGGSALNGARRLDADVASTDFEESIQDDGVSHVLIATRHSAHAYQAEAALRAGKVVHVEKPLCVSREELARLEGVVEELGCEDRLMVGFNRRHSPLSGMLRADILRDRLAPLTILYRVNAGVLDDGHWFFDDPAGRLTAEGCHFIDYCRYLTGARHSRVECVAQGRQGRTFDSFTVLIGYEDGSQASILYSGQGDRSLRKERVEVFQGKRCWVLDDWASLVRYEGGKEKKLYGGKQEKGWKEEMEHFLGVKVSAAAPSWSEVHEVHEAMFLAAESAMGAAVTTGEPAE